MDIFCAVCIYRQHLKNWNIVNKYSATENIVRLMRLIITKINQSYPMVCLSLFPPLYNATWTTTSAARCAIADETNVVPKWSLARDRIPCGKPLPPWLGGYFRCSGAARYREGTRGTWPSDPGRRVAGGLRTCIEPKREYCMFECFGESSIKILCLTTNQ